MDEATTRTYKKISALIDEWLEVNTERWFTTEDVWRYLGLGFDDREPKLLVSQSLWYRVSKQNPPTLKQINKQYRVISAEADTIKWKTANADAFFPIILPFDLHKYVRLHKRSIMVVGGVSNEGKTTFVHNVISLNIHRHQIRLLDSENSDEELKSRFCHYAGYEDWPDDFAKDRSQNFSDVILPDGLNVIDYLDIQDSFFLVGRYIREIRDALNEGVAIVVLQKRESTAKFPSKLPVGGEFSRHLARVVITIDKGILTIIKAKDRAQRNISPQNMKWSFRIDETGTQFLDIQRTFGQESYE